jgi:tetratricopeptide (TPR) repeat protein
MVLPPQGPGGADTAWIGSSVADALPTALARLGVPVVARTERLRAHELLAIPAVPLTRATSIRMAEALGVSRLVEGSFAVDGTTLSLSLRILDVPRGTLSAPLIAAGPLETLPFVVRSLAWDVALAGPVAPRVSRDSFLAGDRRPPPPLEAQRQHGLALAARDPAERSRRLREALRLAPSFDDARVAMARIQVEAGESAQALETLKPIPSTSLLARTALFLAGRAELDLGRYREASRTYLSLAAAAPTVGVLNNYALALLRSGERKSERASDVLRKAVELDPASPDPPFNLGWALLREGEPAGAAFWMQGVLRDDPRDVHARLVLVWSLRQAGRGAEADAEWQKLLAAAPSYESYASPDLARRFERAMASETPPVLDPDRWGDAQLAAAHLGRARKLEEEGDRDGALAELTQAVYLDPYGPEVHRALARLYRAQGDAEKAAGELRMSLWCRDDPAVRLELAVVLLDLGRKDEARAEARRVLKATPSDPEARRLAEGH